MRCFHCQLIAIFSFSNSAGEAALLLLGVVSLFHASCRFGARPRMMSLLGMFPSLSAAKYQLHSFGLAACGNKSGRELVKGGSSTTGAWNGKKQTNNSAVSLTQASSKMQRMMSSAKNSFFIEQEGEKAVKK